MRLKHFLNREMAVAQSAEQLLPTPDVRGSNPDKIYIEHCILLTVLKTQNKEKAAGNGPF